MSKNSAKAQKCPHCGTVKLSGGDGRHLSLRDPQIRAVLAHYNESKPKAKIKDFCKSMGISTTMYRNITRLRVKNDRDRRRILEAAAEVGYYFCDTTNNIDN